MYTMVLFPVSGFLMYDFLLQYLGKPNYSHQHQTKFFVRSVILKVFHQSLEVNMVTLPDQLYAQNTQ